MPEEQNEQIPNGGIALEGCDAELAFTIHIKRAATGEVETYNLVGKIINNEGE